MKTVYFFTFLIGNCKTVSFIEELLFEICFKCHEVVVDADFFKFKTKKNCLSCSRQNVGVVESGDEVVLAPKLTNVTDLNKSLKNLGKNPDFDGIICNTRIHCLPLYWITHIIASAAYCYQFLHEPLYLNCF